VFCMHRLRPFYAFHNLCIQWSSLASDAQNAGWHRTNIMLIKFAQCAHLCWLLFLFLPLLIHVLPPTTNTCLYMDESRH
jgi:hypothetical protein